MGLKFMYVTEKTDSKGVLEVYPEFVIGKFDDLMVRGSDFYAVWNEELGLWSTDELDAVALIDKEVDLYVAERNYAPSIPVRVKHVRSAKTGLIDQFHHFCQRQLRDNYKPLDEKLIFSNTVTTKKDYASKRLPYPLEKGPCPSFEKIMSTLYSPDERHKLEWAIGSIVNGASRSLQKFVVLYGDAGTGKSTILNIIEMLFEGYTGVFDAKALGSSTNAFALEAFRGNPLVAIQHDGDLSRIEDNTRLNSLVSHEKMTVNEKFKSTYTNRFKSFLFMATNRPVKITDSRSGLLRRLIDVSPSGKLLSQDEYDICMGNIPFELGAIAWHCKEVFEENPRYYSHYSPKSMLGASNDFYNFILEAYYIFSKDDRVELERAWEMYNAFCEEAKVPYPYTKRIFKEEMRSYWWNFDEKLTDENGAKLKSVYSGFRLDKFEAKKPEKKKAPNSANPFIFEEQPSLLDNELKDCPAQYATGLEERPNCKWGNVKTTLEALDTHKLHYVKPPENLIVIDFDICGPDGEKSFERNLEAIGLWPKTYAEVSKSGKAIHLHYYYNGDVAKLSHFYDDKIEIKTFTGGSSLRRKLSRCCNFAITTLSTGLPLRGDKKVLDTKQIEDQKHLVTLIKRTMEKEYLPSTVQSVEFIQTLVQEAYDGGVKYDIRFLQDRLVAFAGSSTHNSLKCLSIIADLPLVSKDYESNDIDILTETDGEERPIAFFDCEVFPNLFLVNWKIQGEDSVHRMIQPDREELWKLFKKYRMVGFNNRKYDNHICYGWSVAMLSNKGLYDISKRIIDGDRRAMFGEAYNWSYTDVYDFAKEKKSLKKWEIELGIHHQELGLPWDEPVPEDMWPMVAEYCDNDVIATEATFNHLQADFIARQILAEATGMSVNDTTNTLSTRFIFGDNKHPQSEFNYRDMGDVSQISDDFVLNENGTLFTGGFDEYTRFDKQGRPIFPGYKYEFGKSTYRGEEVGEGGYVYSEPGMYKDIALLDIASMHPSSIEAEKLFGERYTKRFSEIKQTRLYIKHKEFDKAKEMLGGILAKYLDDESQAKDLSGALKIVINSVYGLTDASFENAFRDPRNVDNIVAKRGALFMVNLKHEVQKRGFTVAHIKTDSIKIPDATEEIIQFVMDYGQMYGYTFEHEATYSRMCLVNKAVYICKHDGRWDATGKQFQIPYVFKKLFSKEPICFDDLCEAKQVKTALYLDMNEQLPDVSQVEKELEKLYQARKKPPKMKVVDISAEREEDLKKIIETGHDYRFVGRIGQFCPVKPGNGGGLLMRSTNNEVGSQWASAEGCAGYRWLESEFVRQHGLEDAIDISYYQSKCDEAIEAISQFGDFEWFTSDDGVDEDEKLFTVR